jgi:hypothetical protein
VDEGHTVKVALAGSAGRGQRKHLQCLNSKQYDSKPKKPKTKPKLRAIDGNMFYSKNPLNLLPEKPTMPALIW